jgi:hypothetical protein
VLGHQPRLRPSTRFVSDVCARNRRRTADLIGTPEGMRPHQTRGDRILI